MSTDGGATRGNVGTGGEFLEMDLFGSGYYDGMKILFAKYVLCMFGMPTSVDGCSFIKKLALAKDVEVLLALSKPLGRVIEICQYRCVQFVFHGDDEKTVSITPEHTVCLKAHLKYLEYVIAAVRSGRELHFPKIVNGRKAADVAKDAAEM